MEFAESFLYQFVTLFVILDLVATLPVFIVATIGLTRLQSLVVAAYAVFVSFLVLLFFIAGGQFLPDALKIPTPAFQLAGSIVLLLFGLSLVLGKVTKEAASMPADSSLLDRAIHPLAIPG